MSEVKQKVIVGLGKTGLSCARFLLQKGFSVAVTDSRANPVGLTGLLKEYPETTVSVNGFDRSLMLKADELIVSPGVSLQEASVQAAIDAGIPVIGDIELFCRYVSHEKSAIVAITGSNAKSTVVTLLGEMIAQAGHSVIVAGNIGLPVMDVLLQDQTADFYVLELSSFQLETTHHLNARIATILNVSPDHLDRHENMDAYVAAKQRIYRGCTVAMVNAEDPVTLPNLSEIPIAKLVAFSQSIAVTEPTFNSAPSTYQYHLKQEQRVISREDSVVVAVNDMTLRGGHNIQNALAALTMGHELGLSDESMATTLCHFSGLPHRCQEVALVNGVTWINDSKGTNTGATIAALKGLAPEYSGHIVLIAGGVDKGADFSELAVVVHQHVNAVVFMGIDAENMASSLGDSCEQYFVDSIKSAVEKSQQIAQPGGVVLLSPACASFDMFTGFEDRGNQFIAAVKQLSGQHSTKQSVKRGANAI